MTLKAVAGRAIEAEDDTAEIVAMLRQAADDLEAGEITANTGVVVLMDTTQVDGFSHYVRHWARPTEILAALKVAEIPVMRKMELL